MPSASSGRTVLARATTMRMIHCASPVTSGSLKVLGMDVNERPKDIKRLIGVAPQENNLDPDFSVHKNLMAYSRYFGMKKEVASKKADELLAFMQLNEKRDVEVEALSGGMKRRLVIARALLNDPRILILDEPTTGLDPQARHLIWERIRELKRKKVTVILTTHYMDEAEKLCDRLVIMDKGKIVAEGRPADLIKERIGTDVVEVDEPTDEVEQFAKEKGWNYERTVDRLLIYSTCCEDMAETLRNKFNLSAVVIRKATLEDVFLRLTGRRLQGVSIIRNISWLSVAAWKRNRDVFLTTWKTNFIPPFLEPILYLLAMGLGFGVLISGLKVHGVDVSYLQYLGPSLVAITIMYGGFYECTYGSFVRMHYQKTFDAMIATPLSIEDVIAAEMLWGATKSFINGAIVLAIITVAGLASFPGLLFVPIVAFLGGLMFASLAMMFTAVVPNLDSFNYPFFLLITPMFLFSGTFFPLYVLPGWVQTVAYTLPLTHVTNLVRDLCFNYLDAYDLVSLGYLLLATAAMSSPRSTS